MLGTVLSCLRPATRFSLERDLLFPISTKHTSLKAPPLHFVIPSVPGFPASPLSWRPLMWFSLKRTTCSRPKPQLSTGNLGKPRDLRFSRWPRRLVKGCEFLRINNSKLIELLWMARALFAGCCAAVESQQISAEHAFCSESCPAIRLLIRTRFWERTYAGRIDNQQRGQNSGGRA